MNPEVSVREHPAMFSREWQAVDEPSRCVAQLLWHEVQTEIERRGFKHTDAASFARENDGMNVRGQTGGQGHIHRHGPLQSVSLENRLSVLPVPIVHDDETFVADVQMVVNARGDFRVEQVQTIQFVHHVWISLARDFHDERGRRPFEFEHVVRIASLESDGSERAIHVF